jgi:pimeloyl-ACP methyl ester carboxylesterase
MAMTQRRRRIWRSFSVLVLAALPVGLIASAEPSSGANHGPMATSTSTVWLCRPGLVDDPCDISRATTVINASGMPTVEHFGVSSDASGYDCFYVYPTVSREFSTNADLRVQKTEVAVASAQAAPFSAVCRVYAPIYRQVTLLGLSEARDLDVNPAATSTAYESLRSSFEDFLAHYNDGRRIIFVGHSQGAAMLILLLQRLVDNNASLRSRVAAAIILGGNVEVPTGREVGGTFGHIPLCTKATERGCVIAYSSFPSVPPEASLFGRVGQGVSLQSGQRARHGLVVACTNPAALSGGSATLEPLFPSAGELSTSFVTYPGLYKAACEQADGATWLDVTKATGRSDKRPVITESSGPEWGYHVDDVNLALGNLLSDVAAIEHEWRESSLAGNKAP